MSSFGRSYGPNSGRKVLKSGWMLKGTCMMIGIQKNPVALPKKWQGGDVGRWEVEVIRGSVGRGEE
jgi:hypothetical protein